MASKRVLVSGLTNIENSVRVHSFPIEYSPIDYLFDDSDISISGTAFNIASALKSLGDEVEYISIVGKDLPGDWIINTLKGKGIKVDNINRLMDRTCSSTVLYDDNGKRKIYCDLRNIQDIVLPIDQYDNVIQECDGLVITNINFNDNLIRQAKRYKKTIFSDVHVLSDIHDSYNKRFMENADILFLSDEHLPCSPEEFLMAIENEYHNQYIILGRGNKGSLLLDGKNKEFHYVDAVHTREVVNTVGAGDALLSAFVHFYLKGDNALDSLKKATFFASYKIGESGGSVGFLNEKELLDLYKKGI